MRRWLKRLFGRDSDASPAATPQPGPAERLEAAQARLKATIPAPPDGDPAA